MARVFRENGLTLTLVGIFAVTLIGQAWSGWLHDGHERLEHGYQALPLGAYLVSGEFLSALFENWESEFLQMWAFVMLTVALFQKGSPESKDPDGDNPEDRDPALDRGKPDAPWPVRRGGVWSLLYERSLGLTLLALFLFSFVFHAINSARAAADEAIAHSQPVPTLWEHLVSASFWFESFQNWQSEFLSTAVLIFLSVYLREKGSPESKPVGTPHGEGGP